MPGLKGQTGLSTNLEKPKTTKQKKDYEAYKKAQRKNREYFTAYSCPTCLQKSENPPTTATGMHYCSNCFMRNSKVVEVKETKSYRVKPKPSKKKKINKKKKAQK